MKRGDLSRNICSVDTTAAELLFIEENLKANGYPEQFIKVHMKAKPERPISYNVPKKLVYLQLPFKDDRTLDLIQRQLDRQIENTFPSAKLRIINNTQRLIPPQGKDNLPHLSNSMCVYLFTCTCGVRYIGRTMRQLSKRMKEHCPVSMRTGTMKTLNSSIVQHLIDSNHVVDPKQTFSVLYSVPRNLNRATSVHLLSTAEAIAIRLYRPELCKQKQLIWVLRLPWP